MVQTVCYVPTDGTTRNYTITHCTAGYYTKYTRYHVGLLRYIRYHDEGPRYIRYKRCVNISEHGEQYHTNTAERCVLYHTNIAEHGVKYHINITERDKTLLNKEYNTIQL